jgi:hypothetical protein
MRAMNARTLLRDVLRKHAGMPVLKPGVTPAMAQGGKITPRLNTSPGPTQQARVSIPGVQQAGPAAAGPAPQIRHSIRGVIQDAMKAQRPNGGQQPGLSSQPAAKPTVPSATAASHQWGDNLRDVTQRMGLNQVMQDPMRLARAAGMGTAGGLATAGAAQAATK